MFSRDVLDAPALRQAELLASGELSAEELTAAYLERIERVNDSVAAFVEVAPEQALREARQRDRARRSGAKLPRFHGVPIGIKDLNLARGMFTRFGSRAFPRYFSIVDDKTTARLRAGGFVVLGKTTTSEFGALPVTEPDIHPPTRNPWDRDVTAGGSSGGAASAVASGMLPIAQGSDGAGSIRIPASLCHLYGMKPSRGRVPNAFGHPDEHIIYTCGPIARTVRDAAAMLDVLAGVHDGRAHWAPAPLRPFEELMARPLPRLRVRFALHSPLVQTEPEIADAVVRVARTLADMGHIVDEGGTPEGTVEEFLPIWQYMAGTTPVADLGELQPITRWLAEEGRRLRAADALARQHALSARVAEWFGDVDLWVTPTVAVPPLPIGALRDLSPRAAFDRAATLGAFTALFNLTGQPAASIPAGVTSKGHPVGVQLVGKPLADALVLAVSAALEDALPWHHRRAPISA